MKVVIRSSVVLILISSWSTTSSQHAPNSAWVTDSLLQDGNLPNHKQSSRSPRIGSSQGINQLPNGQVFTGMGWVDEEDSISHLTTVSDIHSPEECMDACASNRKSNRQGCVAFTFIETIKRCDLKSQTNAHSLKQQRSHKVMSAKCTSGCGRAASNEALVCITESSPNLPCIFPFRFNGVIHTTCIWDQAHLTENKPWCSTLVDEDGDHAGGQSNWGNCGPNCPISPDKRNETISVPGRTNLPATGGKCFYECKDTGVCQVDFEANGAYSGGTRGSCTSEEFGWSGDCSGTPRFCRDCKHKCRGSWGTNFRELVGSEIVGSGQNIPPPPPARTTVRPGSGTKIPPPPPPRTSFRPAPLPYKCQRIRIRKDAHKLTQAEKTQLQRAMNGIIQDGTFQDIASYHGAPYGKTCKLRYNHSGNKMGCCKHRGEGASGEDFWSWHRLYTVQLEEAMEKYLKGTDLGLPYWDWTKNIDIPDVWADIYPEIKSLWSNARRRVVSDDYENTNHIYDLRYNPSVCHNPNGNDFSMIARIWPTKNTVKAQTLKGFINNAMDQKKFEEFTEKADNAHAAIHNELRCSMTSPATTAYDPTFWMHHTYLDKVLAARQANEFYEVPHFNNDGRHILEPFGNSNVNPYELTKITNNQTLDHYRNLCYCYDSLENCAKTSNNDPFFVEKVVPQIVEMVISQEKCKQVCDGAECSVVCEDSREVFETTKYTTISEKISKLSVSVGFIIPKGFGGVSIPYKACYAKFAGFGDPECEDGKLYLFGGSKGVTSDSPVNSENYNIRTSFLFSREITSLTQEDETFRWDSLQLLGYENSLPINAPLFVVVQITNGDKDYRFAQLQEGVKKKGYGNLLDDYNGVKDYGYLFEDLSTLLNK